MKPTPEQIAAAKAWARESMTKDDALQLAWSEATPERILLAALEAAEADGARLDWQVNNYRQAIKWLEDNPELHISYDAGDPEVGVFPVWEILKKIGATSDGPIWETVSVDATFVSAIDAARKEDRT